MLNNVDLPFFPIDSAKLVTFLDMAKSLTYFNLLLIDLLY